MKKEMTREERKLAITVLCDELVSQIEWGYDEWVTLPDVPAADLLALVEEFRNLDTPNGHTRAT